MHVHIDILIDVLLHKLIYVLMHEHTHVHIHLLMHVLIHVQEAYSSTETEHKKIPEKLKPPNSISIISDSPVRTALKCVFTYLLL